jgi:phosphoglycerate dehydrogenase-like enzyme
MTETIVVLDPISETVAARMRALLPEGMVLTHGHSRGDEHLRSIIAEADYAIAGQVGVSGDVLRAAKRLKLLHKWGVGTDNLDLEAAHALGIKVARTSGSNAVAVAEFTLGLMISALRNLAYGHTELKNGEWRGGQLPQDSFMLAGKTVGIVGFGAIGRAVARLLSGFGCRVLYTKRSPLPPAEEASLGATHTFLQELLQLSDVVSLHCPLTPETVGLIDRTKLEIMKRTAVLINVARGGVVVEADLIWALENRVIHAAASDVFETEPLPSNSPLLRLDNLVVTPHLAAMTVDIFAPAVLQMYGNMVRVSRGEPIPKSDLVVD